MNNSQFSILNSQLYHVSALLEKTINGLNIKPDGIYVDLTFGGGGHSKEILAKLNSAGTLVAFDKDKDAFENKIDDDRMIYVQHNFKFLYNFLNYFDLIPVDGIIADLGVSWHQFDVAERGFSFRFDGNLDMRMNQNTSLTARKVLNEYSEAQLSTIFKVYGEIAHSKQLAQAIVNFREKQQISTTAELKEIASKFAPMRDKTRHLSQVFQALRIEVNNEIEALKEMLESSKKVLKKGGRITIISYHSLEDRMVKNFFRTGSVDKAEVESDLYGRVSVPFIAITRKAIIPDEEEILKNPRIRSAKLRIAEKL